MSCILCVCTIMRNGNFLQKTKNKYAIFTEVECFFCFTSLCAKSILTKLSCSSVTIKSHPDLTVRLQRRDTRLNALSVQSEEMYLKQEFILKYDANQLVKGLLLVQSQC